MRLHEEYIHRHRLQLPVFRYDNRSNLFLRSKDTPVRWSVFHIIWRPPQKGPGFYEFLNLQPKHNGHASMEDTLSETYVYWENYEIEVAKILTQFKKQELFPVPSWQRKIMAWEMFLYMFDDWLSKRMNDHFYQYVQRSLSQNLNHEERMLAFTQARFSILNSRDSAKIVEILDKQILPMSNGHSQWLQDLYV